MEEDKKKILVVDDDAMLQEALTTKLGIEGFAVEVAGDGAEGFEKVRSFRPDLVLLDVMMPKVDGLEMFKRLRALPEFRRLPVVLLTNLSSQEAISGALEQGVTTYLVKTEMSLEDVIDRIKVTLDCQ